MRIYQHQPTRTGSYDLEWRSKLSWYRHPQAEFPLLKKIPEAGDGLSEVLDEPEDSKGVSEAGM